MVFRAIAFFAGINTNPLPSPELFITSFYADIYNILIILKAFGITNVISEYFNVKITLYDACVFSLHFQMDFPFNLFCGQ